MLEQSVARRMQMADFVKNFPDLMGGTKIGFDFHALRRSIGRYYKFMSMELLADNVASLFEEIDEMEDMLMGIPENSTFVVFRENDGLVVFGSFALDPLTGSIMVFVHTLIVFDGSPRSKIFYWAENKLLLKLCEDGSVMQNTEEFELCSRDKEVCEK